jgi:hypothetical protein
VGLLTPEFLERWLERNDQRAESRLRTSLPFAVAEEGLPPDDEAQLRLIPVRAVGPRRTANGELELWAHGKAHKYPAAAEPVLRALVEERAPTIRSLCERAAPDMDRDGVRRLLADLMLKSLAAIVPPGSEP